MRLVSLLPVLPAFALATLLGAQSGGNVLHHYDGTAEATSRGDGAPWEMITVLQRYPWNQCCGRTKLCCVEATLQDNNPATPEWCYLEVRGSDVSDALFPLGKPDMTAGGLLFTMPLMLTFTTPVQHWSFTLPACVPLPLPLGTGGAADFYVGFRFNPAPMWPADGVSCHFSGKAFAQPGEQYLSPPKPMYAAAPKPGLGWSFNTMTGALVINTGDLAWDIGAGLFEDVCQPLAVNPTRFTGAGGTGLNPNYGYAGIWPDVAGQGDMVGWRVRTVAPPSSLCVLFLGPNLLNPFPLDPLGLSGLLCIDPLISLVQMTSSESVCATQSNAVFAPFFGGNTGGTFCLGAQALTIDMNNTWHVSTACTSVL